MLEQNTTEKKGWRIIIKIGILATNFALLFSQTCCEYVCEHVGSDSLTKRDVFFKSCSTRGERKLECNVTKTRTINNSQR